MTHTITQTDMDGYCLSLLTEERSAVSAIIPENARNTLHNVMTVRFY